MLKNNKKENGSAIIITLLLAGFIISIALVLSAIFFTKIRTAGDIRRSSAAAYAADSAIEWCLYINRIGVVAAPTMTNGATYINAATGAAPTVADCSPAASSIQIIGTYRGVSRAFEVSF